MMESKIEKKTFGIAEFEEEEKWLETQHINGWDLIKINGTKYEFEKCTAEEWTYQLDFKENGMAEEDYLQIFKDCGWEYVLQNGKWCYFRKKKEDATDLSIFSDRFSKIAMYTKMLQNRHLNFTVALFTISCVIVFLTIFTNVFKGDGGGPFIEFWRAALPWVGAGLLIATSFSFSQYMKLRKMVEELKAPEE